MYKGLYMGKVDPKFKRPYIKRCRKNIKIMNDFNKWVKLILYM